MRKRDRRSEKKRGNVAIIREKRYASSRKINQSSRNIVVNVMNLSRHREESSDGSKAVT